jgi:hypothetical protein
MDDPFIRVMGSRPNSTTVTPISDIDYILSYGIHIDTISTLQQSFPCHSDHLGTVFDIDLACSFSSSYTDNFRKLMVSQFIHQACIRAN